MIDNDVAQKSDTNNNEITADKEISANENAKSIPNLDKHGRSYATGKRKSSIARVWMKLGTGKIMVNGLECEKYFERETHRLIIAQPLETTSRAQTYDIKCTVRGGGHSGQAGALRHGVTKALTEFEPELRSVLKAAGFIKRDARRVERKKYGRPKARRSFQFSKR